MADIGSENKQYWNGILTKGIDNGYSSIVNFDISAPTFSHYGTKLRPTGYYYNKRPGYHNIIEQLDNSWEISDVATIPESSCDKTEGWKYMMAVNRNSNKMFVAVSEIGDCDWKMSNGQDLTFEVPTNIADCFCGCQHDRFLVTDFVKGTPRVLNTTTGGQESITGVQMNIANGTVGIFYDTNLNISSVNVGDWVYVHSTAGDAFSGQARQIVAKKLTATYLTQPHLVLNAPRAYIGVRTQDDIIDINNQITQAELALQVAISSGNDAEVTIQKERISGLRDLLTSNNPLATAGDAIYKVYPERGSVPMYQTCDGLKAIHSVYSGRDVNGNVIENISLEVTTAESSFSGDVCTYSVSEFNQRINLLGDRGYNIAGGVGFNKLAFTVDNQNYVGDDKQSQAVFRNFLVQFGTENMGVIVYNENGQSFSYKLDSSIGIRSPKSWITHQNSLYIIGSDKRLYACNIEGNGGGGYQLILTDQSEMIIGELNLIQEGDDVSMSADGVNIYIFINNKTHRLNSENTKTRILKFYKDYNRWVKHDICSFTITRKHGEYFLGDGMFVLGGGTGNDYMKENGRYVTAYIEMYIGENEDLQPNFNTLGLKQLQFMKLLLGKGIYTDGNTKIVIDSNVAGFKQQYQIDKFEHIQWIDLNNQLRAGIDVTMPECAMEVLAECSNVVRECSGGQKSDETVFNGCYNERVKHLDNCICLDDKSYELADVYELFLNTKHLKTTDLYRVRIMSTGGDEMSFGGLIAGLEVYPFEKHDTDNMDLINVGEECCSEGKHIDVQNPCNC